LTFYYLDSFQDLFAVYFGLFVLSDDFLIKIINKLYIVKSLLKTCQQTQGNKQSLLYLYEVKSGCPFCILAIGRVRVALELETSRFDTQLSISIELNDWRCWWRVLPSNDSRYCRERYRRTPGAAAGERCRQSTDDANGRTIQRDQ
jgi:hypothetical protein